MTNVKHRLHSVAGQAFFSFVLPSPSPFLSFRVLSLKGVVKVSLGFFTPPTLSIHTPSPSQGCDSFGGLWLVVTHSVGGGTSGARKQPGCTATVAARTNEYEGKIEELRASTRNSNEKAKDRAR